jgi:Zeta toxin
MTDPAAYVLGDEESKRIFRDEIVPERLSRARPQERPTVVFVIAQHGSGKTATTKGIKRVLDQNGESIVLDNDRFKPYHPLYRDLMSRDGEFATLATAADGQRWGRMAAEYVRANRFDALIEETVQNPPYFREQAQAWRAAGYRVEAAIMAVPESFSRLGVLDRYQKQLEEKGAGRLPSGEKQRLAYHGVAEVAAMLDREKLVDTVSVWNRDGEAVYFNRLGADGDWVHPAGTRQALEKERERHRTVRESDNFRQVHSRLSETMDVRFGPQLEEIGRQAQPLLAPTRNPDVARLSDAELAQALTDTGYRARIEAERAERLKGANVPAQQAAAEVVQAAVDRENAALAEISAESERRALLSGEQAAEENVQRQREAEAQRQAQADNEPEPEAEPA